MKKKGNLFLTTVLILFLSIYLTIPIFSSDITNKKIEDKYRTSWINAGVGFLSLALSYSYQIDKLLFSIRTTASGQIDDYSLVDFGILVGFPGKRKNSSVLFSLGTGIGLITGSFDQVGDSKTVLNIPCELQLFFKISKKWGLGIYAYCNLNLEKSVWNICLCLQFGRW